MRGKIGFSAVDAGVVVCFDLLDWSAIDRHVVNVDTVGKPEQRDFAGGSNGQR
jgi:hypothetical protein